ncbi:MAG: outer membrane lipoprotein carrier protein LolA [Alphaproteobacteria bacterium]|nr:outer membrane lipoprotein carrier protein LolA [Alphaproteobacteria bacterium]
MWKYVFTIFFFVTSLNPILAQVDNPARIPQIEKYLANLKTFEADLTQQNPDGSQARGKFFLNRPKKFRIKYTEPKELILVSDGSFFIEYDPKEDIPNFISLESTPASLFLQDKITLSGEVSIRYLKEKDGLIFVELYKTKDPDVGSITLIFSDKPMSMIGWIINDAQQNTTAITLQNIKENQPIQDSLFETARIKP